MDYFEEKSREEKSEGLPDWVSKTNKSYEAYMALHQIKSERLEYIRMHNNKTDFKTASKSHEIRAAQVARRADMSNVTLTNTSTYSSNFNKELESVNAFLAEKKDQHLKEIEKKKKEAAKAKDFQKTLNTRASDAEKAIVEKQVSKALDYLNNDIRKLLLLPTYHDSKTLKLKK